MLMLTALPGAGIIAGMRRLRQTSMR